jgi:hypothetical protein
MNQHGYLFVDQSNYCFRKTIPFCLNFYYFIVKFRPDIQFNKININYAEIMRKYLIVINHRTAAVIVVTLIATKLVQGFGLSLNFDLTLLSIAILFPLVFSIRGSFRRRENALEFLSEFKTGLTLCLYSIDRSDKTSEELKQEFREIIYSISDKLIAYINGNNMNMNEVHEQIQKVPDFLRDNKEVIGNNTGTRIIRYMKEVNDGAECTMAVKNHRTPVSLRAYCLVFIYFFPFIHGSNLIARINVDEDLMWVVYLVNCIISFVLITIYNIQEHLEDPFDQDGLDDIKTEDFRVS